jgi:2-methylcitrate synthase/citrate synthase II
MATDAKLSYSPGLEGVIAGETAISRVDPGSGLLYRGYDIDELATQTSFEEVSWLLLHGELPTMSELGAWSRHLVDERWLPPAVLGLLRVMPSAAHPMDSLRTSVSMLAIFDPDLHDNSHEANIRKSARLIAKVSSLITHSWRLAHGKEVVPPADNLTHAGNFLYHLHGEMAEVQSIEALDTVLVLYADHDFNASTFAARVTASTLADIYGAVTSALAALAGPLHGGANEEAMKMLKEIGSPDRAEEWVKTRLAKKEKIMGFGHRVYKKGDSRVPVMRELAQQLGARHHQNHWAEICQVLEAVMEREKQLYANLDLYAAPVLHLLNIPPDLNTPIFACARVAGWCAHILEQHDHNRLIRPRSLYVGPPKREYQAGVKKSAA